MMNHAGKSGAFARAVGTLGLLLSVAATASCASGTPDAAKPENGEPASGGSAAKELQAEFVTGEGPKTIAEAKGKVVIVDFWATYCDPCRKSFPKYQELVDQFGGDLAVIAVSVDEPGDVSPEKIKEFANETNVKFAVVWDKEHKTSKDYNPEKMPTSFVLDKEGNIRHTHAGYETGEEEKIAAEVKELLGK